jgi:hypothetical protein
VNDDAPAALGVPLTMPVDGFSDKPAGKVN